jgi:hypothetical protein
MLIRIVEKMNNALLKQLLTTPALPLEKLNVDKLKPILKL